MESNKSYTTRLQVFIDSLLEDAYKDPLSGRYYNLLEDEEKAKDCDFYRINSKRDILDIPILEVMSAARYAIEQPDIYADRRSETADFPTSWFPVGKELI